MKKYITFTMLEIFLALVLPFQQADASWLSKTWNDL